MAGASIAEQLKPLVERFKASASSIRLVSQVSMTIRSSSAAEFAAVRGECLKWMGNRASHQLPREAWQGESFDLEEVSAQKVAAVRLTKPDFWSARLDFPDRETPQRYWSTELALAPNSNGDVMFGCRLQCITMGKDEPFKRSIPGVVKQLVDRFDVQLDGRRLSTSPWVVEAEDETEELVDLLSSTQRRRDVLVFSLPEGSRNPDETLFPVRELCQKTLGAAHIVILTSPASFRLTDSVGKEFSVFNQAVRTYRPHLDLEEGQPLDHPLALPRRIENWPHGGTSAFLDFIEQRSIANSVDRGDLEREVPTFRSVKKAAIEIERANAKKAGSGDAELLKLAEDEILQLKQRGEEQAQTYTALLGQAEADLGAIQAALQQAQSERTALRARVDHLTHALTNVSAQVRDEVIPDSFEQLEDWASRHLAGAVFLHNRAIRAAQKSIFQDPSFAYRVLLLLRDSYVPMKRNGGSEQYKVYRAALAELGLTETPAFAGARSGEEGEAYFVEFNGVRRELEMHLKGSNSRDPRFGFRLYYFWDEATDQVVVGWMPSHLPTRAS